MIHPATYADSLAYSNAQRALGRFIGGPFHDDHDRGGPGGWWIFTEVEIELAPHDIARPNLSGWRREHLPRLGATQPIQTIPDWICEISSPALDHEQKSSRYARAGVPHYWLIDPLARTLVALSLQRGRWVVTGFHEATSTARVPPFEDIALEIGRLFLPREADEP